MTDGAPSSAPSRGPDPDKVIRLQADHHFSVVTEEFQTLEDYCLALIHQRAYDEASQYVPNRHVLDLGCNNGYGTISLATSGAALVVGVDVSRKMLKEALARPGHPRAKFLPVDGIRLPFPGEAFDVVTSFQVIEHIADYQTYLSEIRRVLRPGGVAMFSTPNAQLRLDPGMTPWNMFHVREFHHHELRDLLAQWFGRVEVLGLFAVDELYAVESKRLSDLREKARRDQRRRLPRAWQVRAYVIDLVKKTLPEATAARLGQFVRGREARRIRGLTPASAVKPVSAFPSFTAADMFYSAEGVDRALDLLAVCRR